MVIWYQIGVTTFFIIFFAWAMRHAFKQSERNGRASKRV
jgi:hypothetical protein